MKLYALIYSSNRYYYKEAFTNKERAIRTMHSMNCVAGYEKFELREVDLPFIGRSVCYVSSYYGFDYDYTSREIRSLVGKSEIYACVDHAKESFQWKEAVTMSSGRKDSFIITDTKIASKESDGSEFNYGDCMCGKFNVSIKRIRVVKD